MAYRGDGKLEQAIASFEKALAIYPRHAWSYAQWGATLADIDHRDKGAVAEDTVRIVAQKLDRALELRPDDPNLLSLLRTFGQAYWLQEWSAQPHDADHPAGEI
jgi:tetratricopeptide (TPR) repeat protein